MKYIKYKKNIYLLFGLIAGLLTVSVSASTLNLSQVPLNLSTQVKPNILIMLDNSGSMKKALYSNNGSASLRANYSATTVYTGMFKSTSNYIYDLAIPVDSSTFPGVLDTTKTGAFKVSSCLPSSSNSTCWSGNFLNWLVTRRIDATRNVLIGGKLESRSGFAYNAYSAAIEYKIVGNNEPSDETIRAQYNKSSELSPISDNTILTIKSTVKAGSKSSSDKYHPYAIIETPSGSTFNIAVVVDTEPKGLLHDVKDTVRIGISFYYFDPNANDIYNGNKEQGGTLTFNLPKNPFVLKPTNTALPSGQQGYRALQTGYVGSSISVLVDVIEHMPLVWGTTPLAENLWEVIQYFEQDASGASALSGRTTDFTVGLGTVLDPYYVNGSLQSCVQSRVLLFTDGQPYRDAGIPSAIVDYDGDSNARDQSDASKSAPVSKGNHNLDDVAYWSFCNKSLKPGNTCKNSSGIAIDPNRDLRTDLAGNQYLTVDTIAFANGVVSSVMQATADNAGGTAYAAADGATLKASLAAIFSNAIAISSSVAIAANSTRLDSSTLIYQAQFDGNDWSGQLKAFSVNATTGAISSTATWDTDTAGKIPAFGSRNIFSYNASGVDFVWANLSSSQQSSLVLASEGVNTTNAQKRVSYIRGSSADEISNSGIFRDRNKLLGDIVNSSPWFAGAENFGYSTVAGSEGNSYPAFLTSKSSRTKALYVGANDGMLHAFNATTGSELFAYIPATIISKLHKLTNPAYGKSLGHDYFVDGASRAGDVYFSSNWHTVLVGSTGAGGTGVFALDVTTPSSFSATDVLWEFNSSNDADMGYSIAEPTIARMANGKWVAIVPNGYNSANDKAVLFIIDIETGSVIKKFDTKVGGGNGLSTAVPVDSDGDHNVDAIYAGDLKGNLWKFDVSGSSASSWKIAFGDLNVTTPVPEPLFVAKDSLGNRQPITAKPQVGLHPTNGVMIYFGTGKYFEVNDQIVGSTPQVQSYYAIRDNFVSSTTTTIVNTPVVRASLQQQSILAEQVALTYDLRVTSNLTVDYITKKGWYMDLLSPVNGAEGERVVSASLLRNNRIIFVTLIPNSDFCNAGGSSWLMEMDAISGSRLTSPAFDISGDSKFTVADNLAFDVDGNGTIDPGETVVVSGKRSKGGITNTPSVINDGDREFKYTTGSKSTVDKKNAIMEVTTESSSSGTGRESWRQIKVN